MKVRCALTNCKYDTQKDDGYFCNCKEVHICYFYSSDEKEKGEQMKCEQREDTNER